MTHYITRVQTWWCDHRDCLTSYEGQGYASQVWAEASKDGWRTSNGRHLCPQHSVVRRGHRGAWPPPQQVDEEAFEGAGS